MLSFILSVSKVDPAVKENLKNGTQTQPLQQDTKRWKRSKSASEWPLPRWVVAILLEGEHFFWMVFLPRSYPEGHNESLPQIDRPAFSLTPLQFAWYSSTQPINENNSSKFPRGNKEK